MKEILKIFVTIHDTIQINGVNKRALFLSFSGYAEGDCFNGEIMPNAVDVQTQCGDGVKKLFARYVLKGKDFTGSECYMYIENSASDDNEYTIPEITTDSSNLSYLEKAKLKGKIENVNGQVVIHIFAC